MNWTWLDTTEDHQRWGVAVKSSTLLGSIGLKELGLYTIRHFRSGEKIAPYLGEELSLEQRHQRYGKKWGMYVYYKPWGHPSIDAIYYRGAAAFANDGSWVPSGESYSRRVPDLSNVYLDRGWLKASRDISDGEELLLNYGESYWKNRFTGDKIVKFEHPKLIVGESLSPSSTSSISSTSSTSSTRSHQSSSTTHLQKIQRKNSSSPSLDGDLQSLTPVVELHNNSGKVCNWVKRDDLFEICGVRGGKARSCFSYVNQHLKEKDNNIIGLITGGSRSSPQVQIVGHIAHCLSLKARLHLPKGPLPKYIKEATTDLGHEVFQWFPGFNHVISSRVKEDTKRLQTGSASKWLEIPFGMEFQEAIQCTANQVSNLPLTQIRRIILPVGSGMTLIGILVGLKNMGITNIPIIGITVGKDPIDTISKWATKYSVDYQNMVKLIKSPLDYHKKSPITMWQGIPFDPIYESKIIPFIKPGDLIWLVGHR